MSTGASTASALKFKITDLKEKKLRSFLEVPPIFGCRYQYRLRQQMDPAIGPEEQGDHRHDGKDDDSVCII